MKKFCYTTSWQFGRFGLVGVANTLIDFSLYITLTRQFTGWPSHYLVANVIAFLVANIFSFMINRSWTFHGHDRRDIIHHYGQFLLVSLTAVLMVESALFVGHGLLGWTDLGAKVIGTGLAVISSFFLHKYWTFKPSAV